MFRRRTARAPRKQAYYNCRINRHRGLLVNCARGCVCAVTRHVVHTPRHVCLGKRSRASAPPNLLTHQTEVGSAVPYGKFFGSEFYGSDFTRSQQLLLNFRVTKHE